MQRDAIILSWSQPFQDRDDERWGYSLALYAYLRRSGPEILYIGKADGRTVRQRLNDSDKHKLYRHLRRQRQLKGIRVIVASINAYQRITRQLVLDIESLLIHRVKPWGNIQSKRSRNLVRQGMVVCCIGKAWPHRQRTFIDD